MNKSEQFNYQLDGIRSYLFLYVRLIANFMRTRSVFSILMGFLFLFIPD